MGEVILSEVRILSALRLRSDLHLFRKIWHIITGLAGFFIYYKFKLSTEVMAQGLMLISALAFAMEFLRLRYQKLNLLVLKLMGPLMRDSEKNSISGMPFYALGISLSLFFFPDDIAILSALFLIIADPVASFCGVLYGRNKILPNKSLQGTMAAFLVCYMITLIYGLRHDGPHTSLLFFSILAGMIGALSELCSQFVDDNLCIPVLSGLGIYLLNFVITVY